MQTSFFDSRRNTQLTDNFHPSVCTIRAATQGHDQYYQPADTWADVVGLVALPCSIQLIQGQETKGQYEYGQTTHRVALNGVYPTITRLHRAVVDGITYDIRHVSPPGYTNSITVLECTLTSGGALVEPVPVAGVHSSILGDIILGDWILGES